MDLHITIRLWHLICFLVALAALWHIESVLHETPHAQKNGRPSAVQLERRAQRLLERAGHSAPFYAPTAASSSSSSSFAAAGSEPPSW